MATAVLGGGCFWCTEAVFAALQGVDSVEPGYCGGHVERPTYEQVCDKNTGHIEVVRVSFDPQVISFEALLEVFFATHDPTTPGRQGNDVGPQYESAVFYQDDSQQQVAQATIDRLNTQGVFSAPICTQVLPASRFWVAEDYHHDFFARNPGQGYCQFIVAPKVQKLHNKFPTLLKNP
jgi:peptide-methionine (S)-S-oxide reductase